MPILLIVVIVIAALAAFEYAALRWGCDTRDDFRLLNRYDGRRSAR